MDKYEYKVRSQEIRNLIAEGEYAEAAEIADTIDWRRVKSVMMLCTISDLYKINRRFEESKELLLLAYERHPGGRTIVYSLCELSIKMGEFVQAIEYYKEFVQIAPKDTGRYILQYKLYVAQEVSLEERIEVLEEFKKRDYREKWAYELAYLYHRVGLATRCVEECDELILYFGEGKYVTKAMELKMLHQPLTPEQQAKYEGRFEEYRLEQEAAQNATALPVDEDNPIDVMTAPTVEISNGELEDIQVKTLDVGRYNTINLQKELADSMKDLWESAPAGQQPSVVTEEYFSSETGELFDTGLQEEEVQEELPEEEVQTEEIPEELQEEVPVEFQEEVPVEFQEEVPVEFQEEAPEGLQEEIPEEYPGESQEELRQEQQEEASNAQKITQAIIAPLFQDTDDMTEIACQLVEESPEEDAAGESAEETAEPVAEEPAIGEGEDEAQETVTEAIETEAAASTPETETPASMETEAAKEDRHADDTARQVLAEMQKEITPRETLKRPGVFDKYLGMEYDGQMSFVVPESEKVEKQITGQLNIEDILAEWERMKKENEEKCAEEVRQLVLQHTGNILVDFDQAVKDGLLEKLENSDETTSDETVPETAEAEEAETEELEEAETEEAEAEELEEAETEEAEAEELEEVETEEAETEELEEAETEEAEAEELEEVEAEEAETEESEAVEAEEISEDETAAEAVSDSGIRELTREEKELYASFIQNRKSKEQLIHAIDSISLAAYTGNVIITGEEGMDTLTLAKNMMKEVQMTDSNFSGKIAKISGSSLNQRDPEKILGKLDNGALIIESAGRMNAETAGRLHKALQQENKGIIVIMEGTKKSIHKLLEAVPALKDCFTARVNIEALDNDTLVAFAKKYALEREYSIDEMGLLALHTRISERQTSDHAVTLLEVKEMMEDAIDHANRKTLGHFFDILFAKRYDEEDMIILRENDFI